MCGICGVIALDPNKQPARDDIETMKRFLTHRGPDSDGTYINSSAALGHMRLSIIDLSESGNQPMPNEDGTVWIVFNGEIYNFQELKSILIQSGHRFISRTDTEVVVHAYEEWGTDCINKFEGAFAFVIWDENLGRLFAARDRFGEKPLYYSMVDNVFYFASELAPLLQVLPNNQEIDPIGLDLFLSYLFIPAPYTIFSNVRQLTPAHVLIADNKGGFQVNRYWYLSFANVSRDPLHIIKTQIRDLLRNSVSMRLTSDVPIGVLLSGGIDSAAIVAPLREITDGDITTFTIGTTDPNMNELQRARTISKLFRTKHNEFTVKPDAVDILPKLVYHFGQPYADSSAIPTYYVSSIAREHVKVVLSGDGGDEMFAGYNRYQNAYLLQIVRGLSSPMRMAISGVSKKSEYFVSTKFSRQLRNLDRLMRLSEPEAFANSYVLGLLPLRSGLYKLSFKDMLIENNAMKFFASIYSKGDGLTLLDRWINADLLTMLPGDYLAKVDIASMACSLEVRVPFLDNKLAEFSASIPSSRKMAGGKQKALLKEAFQGILPNETLNHRKTGFSVPVHHWLRNELAEYVDKLVIEGKSDILESVMDTNLVRKIILAQRKGDNSQTTKVWGLLNLVIWEKMLYKNPISIIIPKLKDLI